MTVLYEIFGAFIVGWLASAFSMFLVMKWAAVEIDLPKPRQKEPPPYRINYPKS